jgi:peptidoglycan hydrolase-like protein with peptidoglycan-binding domain
MATMARKLLHSNAAILLSVLLAAVGGMPTPTAAEAQAQAQKKSAPAAKKPAAAAKKPAARKAPARQPSTAGQTAPTAERIREIQEALIASGHFTPPATGRVDARTSQAISRFQADHGLDTTGKIGVRTLTALENYGLRRNTYAAAKPPAAESSEEPEAETP